MELVKYMKKEGFSLQEYKEWLQYTKDVATSIVEKLKNDRLSGTGCYQAISLLESFFPQCFLDNQVYYNALIIELKKLHVEFYGNDRDWRY